MGSALFYQLTDTTRYFWERHFSKLHEKQISHIFFESGSSIAYVSPSFIENVKSQSYWFYDQRMYEQLHLRTNNLLTYLDFLLCESPWRPIDVRLQPPGPVSSDYGGTYGILNFAVPESAPGERDAIRLELPENTQRHVDTLVAGLKQDFGRTGLVLMPASGLDTRSESPESPYLGPHVGSYPNMLFKRCLLSLSCPRVLFLDPVKWKFDFQFNNCHAVCDKSFPWETVKSSGPLAIALAAETREDQERLGEELRDYGFPHLDPEEPKAGRTGPWSLIAANDQFVEYFRKGKTNDPQLPPSRIRGGRH